MNWVPLQSGIGIEICGGNLCALCVKRQFKRIRVADRLVIPDYQKLGPQRCGELYEQFLKRNGLKTPWTVVALPRSRVLLRALQFPSAVQKDLAHAVEYQLDSLHPFDESSIYWDFSSGNLARSQFGASRAGADTADRIDAIVAIAQKSYIDETANWFQEAGIGVSQFTVTTAAELAALQPRVEQHEARSSPSNRALCLLTAGSESVEITGYAPGVSLVSREIPIGGSSASPQEIADSVKRELELVHSELRLDPDDRPPLIVCGENLSLLAPALSADDMRFSIIGVDDFFATLTVGAEGFRVAEHTVALAAGIAAADRSLPFSLNLLPAERRSYQSRLVYLPAYALSVLIVLLAFGLSVRGTVQDWMYSRYIDRQIRLLQPQLKVIETAQAKSQKAYDGVVFLETFRNTGALSLAMLDELTRLLPETAWLQFVQFDGDTLSLSGSAESASGVLQILASSVYFENPQFLSPINRTQDGKELFRIGVRVRKPGLAGLPPVAGTQARSRMEK